MFDARVESRRDLGDCEMDKEVSSDRLGDGQRQIVLLASGSKLEGDHCGRMMDHLSLEHIRSYTPVWGEAIPYYRLSTEGMADIAAVIEESGLRQNALWKTPDRALWRRQGS
jgi:hypothetical protein